MNTIFPYWETQGSFSLLASLKQGMLKFRLDILVEVGEDRESSCYLLTDPCNEIEQKVGTTKLQ